MLLTVKHYSNSHNRHDCGLVPIERIVTGAINGPAVGGTTFFDRGARVERHWHDHCQFVYAASGTMVVRADEALWLVPPNRAVWLPSMTVHEFYMTTEVELHTIYVVDTTALPEKFQRCCVLQVSTLLSGLVDRVRQFETCYEADTPERRLVAVLIDEIAAAPSTPLFVPFPEEPRLQKLAETVALDPGNATTLAAWASELGASERTIARLFKRETGLSFVQWRQQIRLLGAIQQLGEGRRVTDVAIEFGYGSTSAFINLFKKNLGTTPGRYFN